MRQAGVETALITGERSLSVLRRAEKLRLPRVYLGVSDKAGQLARILMDFGIAADAVALIGDDVNDLPLMQRLAQTGLTACPSDAMRQVRAAAHYCSPLPGGHGAFRDFAEWLLDLRAPAS